MIDLSPKVNAKSVLAAVAAGATAALYALDGGITANEAYGILAAVLVPLGIVWRVPNADSTKTAAGKHTDVPTTPPDEL